MLYLVLQGIVCIPYLTQHKSIDISLRLKFRSDKLLLVKRHT